MIDEAVEEEQGTKVNPIPLSFSICSRFRTNVTSILKKKSLTDDLSSNVHFGKYKLHFQFALDIRQRVWKYIVFGAAAE